MVENCDTVSISLPKDLMALLEEESNGVHGRKSAIIQEELYNRKQRKQHEGSVKHAFIFFLISIILTLCVFAFLLLPDSMSFLPVLLLTALSSIVLCFMGMFYSFKKRSVVKI